MLSAFSSWELFNLMYKPGRVYVMPPIKNSRLKEKSWLSDADVDVPFDPHAASPPRKRARKVDVDKVEKNRGNIIGEAAEDVVASLMQQTFQTCTSEGEPAVVIQKAPQLPEGDADLIVFHRQYGVILVQVKGDPETKSLLSLQKAAKQVLRARESVRRDTEDLQAVTLVVALPNFHQDAMQDAAGRFPILQQNPDIDILCGTTEYSTWLQQLPPRPEANVWGSGPRGDEAFATAVSRKLPLCRLNQPPDPCQVLREHASFYRNWLMTPDQAEVCLSQHPYLHIWGPPGAGKTLLLLDRAIRWLREEKVVVIVVGNDQQGCLLGSLGRAILSKVEEGTRRMKLFCGTSARSLQGILDELLKDDTKGVCLVADEAEDDIFRLLMVCSPPGGGLHTERGRLAAAWSANKFDFSGVRAREAEERQWVRINLAKCLRCPQYIVKFAASLVADNEAPMVEFPIPAPRCHRSTVKVINHLLHHQQDKFNCHQCRVELQSTGIPFEGSYSDPKHLSDWIVLLCGTHGSTKDKDALEEVLQWLQKLNLRATWEDTKQVSSIRAEELHTGRPPLADRSNTSAARPPRDLEDKQREGVVAGWDRKGHTVVHLTTADAFQGLEKPGVLLVHCDWQDGTAGSRGQGLRERHQRQWFTAATRCQGELVVIVLTPSPVAHMLTKNPSAFSAAF